MSYEIVNTNNVAAVRLLAERAQHDTLFCNYLLSSISSHDIQLAYRASWAITHFIEKERHKDLSPFLSAILLTASSTKRSGIKRNIFKILQLAEIPSEYHLKCAELALSSLNNHKEEVAVRAYALSILENLMTSIPEMIEEVLFIIEKERPFAGAAFIVRSRRFEKMANVVLSKRL